MPPTPSKPDERRELVLRIKRFIETLEATERRPTPNVVERLTRALGEVSAGDLREARLAILDAERTSRFILGRRSVVSAPPDAVARLRQRLEAVMQDIGL